MRCPQCQEENPAGARFCADCGTRLPQTCARCGTELPPSARFCPGCAHPVSVEAQEAPRFGAPEAYTPKHLAERILTSRVSLEGERKQVTVLFADLKGSMEMLADRDPEEARRLLDPILECLMEAVHHYEGTVNQVMGDGIMALFGAPLAHEDHAVRACYAAIRMQDAVRRRVAELGAATPFPLQIRVGLNSGEVVVRTIGGDLRMDYSAVGQTTHLAARMEQLAPPGHTLLTDRTRRLVEGYITMKPLGPAPVKGLPEPVEIYELLGAGPARSRLQAAAARGLTRFVGREAELAELTRIMEGAGAARGQIVAIVGEPGMGKSRLIAEFTHTHLPQRWRVVEAGTVSYGKSAYLAITALLRSYFQIEEGDDGHKTREKVTAQLLGLDPAFATALDALLALLDVPVEDPGWQGLDPPERRRRILDAVKHLLLRQSRVQPLCVVVEDLHWIDSESQAVLDTLAESLPAARVLLIVSYRPGYRHGWASKTYYAQFQVDPLPRERAEELLLSVLGEEAEWAALAQLLIDRTEGNPLFLEESIRDLTESRILVGEPGAYRLAKPLGGIQVPATVQAVLATRIDRLSSEDKTLLQTAAVIGRDVPVPLLEAVGAQPEETLRRSLARLRAAEFLYEVALFPHPAYAFRHALTLEVAYGSLLHERRRALHAQILDAIERLYGKRLAEHAERLAHHAVRGQVWDKAVDYLRQSAAKAYARGAIPESVDRYEEALTLIPRLPAGLGSTQRAIDIRLDLHGPLMVLGRVARLLEVGQEAQHLARQLADSPRLGRALYQMGYYFWLSARYAESTDCGQQALAIATSLDDPTIRGRGTHLLGLNHLARGEYPAAIEGLTRLVDGPDADAARRRLSLLMTYVDVCGWLAFCLAAVGEFDRALAYADRAVELADGSKHPQAQAIAYGFRAIPPIVKGDFAEALPWCERANHLCQTKAVVAWIPTVRSFWGWALAWLGRTVEGLVHLEEAAKTREQMGVPTHLALFYFRWAEGLLLAGRPLDARRAAERALALATAAGERGYEALALHVLGEVAATAEPADAVAALDLLQRARALADQLGIRPLVARCHLSAGSVLGAAGESARARDDLSTAARLFEAMDMGFWLTRVRSEAGKLSG